MDTIVLYPFIAIGHLIPMVELGKLIIKTIPSFSVTVLLTTPPFYVGAIDQYISSVTPSIKFHCLPQVSLPREPTSYSSLEAAAFDFVRLNNPNVHQSLSSLSLTTKIHSLIVDFICMPALSIAANLKIPGYTYFPSSLSNVALYLYIPATHQIADDDNLIHVPGLPRFSSYDKPKPMFEQGTPEFECCKKYSAMLAKSEGIIVNTFNMLEPRAFKAISEGLCSPHGVAPPVFCVGPLMATSEKTTKADGVGLDDSLKWLDSQPSRSVIFLSFGSMGMFSVEQIKEIAIGLEKSRMRFLWVVRNPPAPVHLTELSSPQAEPDLASLLPEGFLDRTKEKGLVVKSWVPQIAVLNHDSVGGFVTHCGWNSVLEAVFAGVPMVAWPLYAEQRFNRVMLVKEMKLALPMDEEKDGFVRAREVEERVRELMESKEGESIRKRVTMMRDYAKASVNEGGSSRLALAKLVEPWSMDAGMKGPKLLQ